MEISRYGVDLAIVWHVSAMEHCSTQGTRMEAVAERREICILLKVWRLVVLDRMIWMPNSCHKFLVSCCYARDYELED